MLIKYAPLLRKNRTADYLEIKKGNITMSDFDKILQAAQDKERLEHRQRMEAQVHLEPTTDTVWENPLTQSVTSQSQSPNNIESKVANETSQIRDFPKELVRLAQAEFPEAKTMPDALSAFMIVKSGHMANDIPDSVKELVNNYKGENTLKTVEERLQSMERKIKESTVLTEEIHLAMTYVLFDRLGFRLENPRSPSKVNLSESGMSELRQNLSEQTRHIKALEQIKEGRRFR